MKVIIDFCEDFKNWIRENKNFIEEDTKSRDEDKSEDEGNDSDGDNTKKRRITREKVDTTSRMRLINSEVTNPFGDNA